VLVRIRSLAPEDTTSVLKFQENRRSCLATVLRGVSPDISEIEPKDAEGPKEATSGSGKSQNEGEKTKKLEAEA
jgi:hypothetical protein